MVNIICFYYQLTFYTIPPIRQKIARSITPLFNLSEFISRHSSEGKFTFVDQRVGGILGYTPSELLGHPCYEFFHPEDLTHMRESFEQGETS